MNMSFALLTTFMFASYALVAAIMSDISSITFTLGRETYPLASASG